MSTSSPDPARYRVVPNVFLDAAALVVAHRMRDGAAVERILTAHSPSDLTLVMAQLLATAIGSPRMTIEEWVDEQIERTPLDEDDIDPDEDDIDPDEAA